MSKRGDSQPKMIETIEIERFRCYRQLALSGLKTFNLIVGDNSSGKTALLEAVFLAASGSPDAYFKTRAWRGMGAIAAVGSDRSSYEAFFRNLFNGFDTDSVISIRFTDDKRGERSLSIAFGHDRDQIVSLPLRATEPKYESTMKVPINFEWKSPEGVHATRVDVSDEDIKFSGSNNFYPAVFVTPFAGSALSSDSIQRFSRLSRRRQEHALITTIAKCFPQVEGMSLDGLRNERVVCKARVL